MRSELTVGSVPAGWQTDGRSFAPTLFGKASPKRDWAFFWYDPRPGWDKERFSRHIFALNHKYKLFSDGRLYDIEGLGVKEERVPPSDHPDGANEAREKLQKVIDKVMAGPRSPASLTEVDAHGDPVQGNRI